MARCWGRAKAHSKAINFPVCVILGNDKTHSIAAGHEVHKLIPGAELHELRTDQLDADLISMDEWVPNEKLAPVVVGFLRRATSKRK